MSVYEHQHGEHVLLKHIYTSTEMQGLQNMILSVKLCKVIVVRRKCITTIDYHTKRNILFKKKSYKTYIDF